MSEADEGEQPLEMTGAAASAHEAVPEGGEPAGRPDWPEDLLQERGGGGVLYQKDWMAIAWTPKKAMAMKKEPAKKIFVGDLNPEATKEKKREYFHKFGEFPENVQKHLLRFLTLQKWKEITSLDLCLQDGCRCSQPYKGC